MQTQDRNTINELEREASTRYDQGQIPAALETWRKLLLLDPDNERALDGVRRCETLSDGGYDPEVDRGLEESLEVLDQILGGGESADPSVASDTAPHPGGHDPAVRDEMGDLDFDLSALDGIDGPISDDPGVAPTANEPEALDWDPDSREPQSALSIGDQAAAEVRIRVGELLTDARAFYERGDKEGALSILSRVSILDEENDVATQLGQQIRAEIEAEMQAATPDEPDGAEEEKPFFTGNTLEEPDSPSPGSEPSLETDSGSDLDPAPIELNRTPEPDAGASPPPPAIQESESRLSPEVGTAWKGPQEEEAEGGDLEGEEFEAKPSPRRWLLTAVAVVVLLAAAAFFAMQRIGSGDDPASAARGTASTFDAGKVQTSSRPGATAGLPDSNGADPAGGRQVDARGPSGSTPEVGLSEILARANAAFRSGDFSAAVVAFNEVLEADPGNAVAKRGLASAGARYREQKRDLERWDTAVLDFNRGNYRAALAGFYRFPQAQHDPRLERYKRNGWYNLGLQALKLTDCKTAVENFEEAGAIDPSDPGVARGIELARTCVTDTGELTYRALDD